MADKISLEQINELQTVLRAPEASIDVKVQHVTAAKSSIKQHNVPDTAVAPLFDALRIASASQHAVLVNAGFTAVGHLLTRLSRQEPRLLSKEAARTLPLIIEKLGDQKDKFRVLALQMLVTLYAVAPMEVERFVRNTAMAGKNPRAKEMAMQWLLQMHHDQGLPFRAYVPSLMELLEDADGMVRDAAKATVLDLFRNAPNGAKADLKKQLKTFKVRPAIEQAIVKELAPTGPASSGVGDGGGGDSESFRSESRALRPAPLSSSSAVSSAPERPVTPMPDAASRLEQVEPTYVNTQRELEETFRDMHAWFEGKETEQNWLKREESITKMRRLVAGNAADFADSFLAGVRGLLDGIIKAMISLRTSLCKEGCSLIQDVAHVFGPAIDPMVELLLQSLIKLSAGTKKISSQLANTTIDAILAQATYNTRIMQHVWAACQDKNVQPRTYAAAWVRTILVREARHRERFEHSGGLDLLEKCIKKGLVDPNPGVRERMRATYWAFSGFWPARAEVIMSGLEATAQRLLQNDPNNPNSPKKGDSVPARPGLGLSKSTMTSSKPSLRETMLAKKREAMASRNLPVRPGSAMAHFSPVRTVSGSSNATGSGAGSGSGSGSGTSNTTSFGRQRAEGGASGGLSNAPVRPAKRRPELHARPATAGPYSVRSHDQPSMEQSSPPERIRSKTAVTPKSLAASPKRMGAARPRLGHQATASESSVLSPSRSTAALPSRPTAVPTRSHAGAASATATTPRSSPPKPRTARAAPAATHHSSPVRPRLAPAPPPPVNDENLAFVRDMDGEPSPPPLKVYEDPFSDDQATPKQAVALFTTTALEDKQINEDVVLATVTAAPGVVVAEDVTPRDCRTMSPEKMRQNARLLDSGIARVKAQTLDVHGFRRLQGVIRDAGSVGGGSDKATLLTDERFDALLLGLFAYLEAPPTVASVGSGADKAQDVKAQILATIKLLLKKARDNFQPHVTRGLEALLTARAAYDARTHIVAGLELLADELAALGDASEIVVVLSKRLGQGTDTGLVASPHSLSMGLHVLRMLVDGRPTFQPSDTELGLLLTGLAQRCLDSSESGVRMDAVQLCVAMHERVGDGRFWAALPGVRDDPRSLITYYIVKRQREQEVR